MVFTLTAAMLVGTPLTASAAGLVDLYQVEDGEGNVIPDQGNPDNTRTGTVTVTQTYTTTLEAENHPIGIYLDNSSVELEYPTPGSLTAKIEWDVEDSKLTDKDKALEADMLKNLVWQSDDTAVVALEVPNGKYNGDSRATIKLNPKAMGTANVTVSLNSKNGRYNFSASAAVNVKQYATDLAFDNEIDKVAYIGDSIDLNKYVERYVDGKVAAKDNGTVKSLGTAARKVPATSDTLTFSLKANPAKAATLKNGILTINKSAKEGDTIRILAIGQNSKEKVGTEWHNLTIQKGVNATKIAFVDTEDKIIKKDNIRVNAGLTIDVTAKVTKTDVEGDCTNKISWSSKKPEIVAVQTSPAENLPLNKNKSTVTIVAKPGSAGKTAQIIAKTSNGKTATLSVKVSADLTSIKIENDEMKLYSGQTIDLYDFADQYFGKNKEDQSKETGNKNFTDAGLKWSFDATGQDLKDMKSAASISTKGVLTVKPDLSKAKVKTVKVTAKSAKKVNGDYVVATKPITITVEQVNITAIIVNDDKGNELIKTTVSNGKVGTYNKKITETVEVGQTRAYTLSAKAEDKDGNAITDPTVLKSVLGWSASGNGKIVSALRTADAGTVTGIGKGKTATISVTAASKKTNNTYKAVKVTFKDKVTATTSTLALNVKNKGIAATTKNQAITITPVLEKGSTTNKKNDLIWTAVKYDKDGNTAKTYTANEIKNGKLKDKFANDAGGRVVVTARVKNGGPSASITLPIVVQSTKITINDKKPVPTLTNDAVTVQTKINDKVPGEAGVSEVTYTVNKAGVVRIKDLGKGNLEITPVTNGKVKITATTLDGKKASINITVKNVDINSSTWSLEQ